jgi:hypothetical protein
LQELILSIARDLPDSTDAAHPGIAAATYSAIADLGKIRREFFMAAAPLKFQ